MQTSAKGTYSGMLDCAGGILRNEGPLAFYKAGSETASPHYPLTVRKLGHFDSVAGHRSLRLYPIWRSRIYQALFHCTKHPKWERGCARRCAEYTTAAGRGISGGTGQRIRLWTGRTHTDTCVTSTCMRLHCLSCRVQGCKLSRTRILSIAVRSMP
jgi:hypothetical protein